MGCRQVWGTVSPHGRREHGRRHDNPFWRRDSRSLRARWGSPGGQVRHPAVVAEGGFRVVYRGVHRTLHKPIAVKVLKVPEGLSEALRKEFLDKFAQEARTIAQLEHPAIVRVIDFGASPCLAARPRRGWCWSGSRAPPWKRISTRRRGPRADPRGGARVCCAHLRGAGLRARRGHRPPRHQARQHHARGQPPRRGERQAARLRHREVHVPGRARLGRHDRHAQRSARVFAACTPRPSSSPGRVRGRGRTCTRWPW
jgi:hypothetical protein